MSPRYNRWPVRSAAVLVAVLVGCSPAESPSSGPPYGIKGALSEYGAYPCALLDGPEFARFLAEHDLDDFEVMPPPRELGRSEGIATTCHWVVPTGIQLSWLPYPEEDARRSRANERDARHFEIAGYPAVEFGDEDSCYVDVSVSAADYFSTLATRTEPEGPEDTCALAASFSDLIIATLREVSQHSTPAR